MPGKNHGRVSLPDGGPAVAARVFAVLSTRPYLTTDLAETDHFGNFDVELPEETLWIVADKEGHGPGWVRVDCESPPAGELQISLLRGSAISGRVRSSEGRPIAGATIEAHSHEVGWMPYRSARSKADGKYVLKDLRPLPHALFVHAPGYAPSHEFHVPSACDDADFVLRPESRIEGVVVRALDGSPVAHATVTWNGNAAFLQDGIRTDEVGRFVIGGLRSGWCTVRADAEGFAPCLATVDLPGEAVSVPLRMEFRPGGTIRGRVARKGDHKPIAGVFVTCLPPDLHYDATFHQSATTDTEGRFEIPCVAPGERTLEAGGQALPRVRVACTVAGETTTEVEISVPSGGVLRGRLVGPEGAGMSGVTLSASGGEPWGHRSAVSGADGRFEMDGLAPGSWILFANVPSEHDPLFVTGYVSASVRIGEFETAECDVRLDRGTKLVGRLRRGGLPLEGHRVAILPTQAGQWHVRANTRADGLFIVRNLSSGALRMRVDGITRSLSIPSEVREWNLDIDVSPSTVQGRVVDAITRHGIEGVAVTVLSVGPPPRSTRDLYEREVGRCHSEVDGSFRLAGLDAGEYLVAFVKTGYTLHTEAAQMEPDGRLEFDASLAPTADLIIKLVDGTGNQVPGATLCVADEAGCEVKQYADPRAEWSPGRYPKGLEGPLERKGLVPGLYRGEAIAGDRRVPFEVLLGPGERKDLLLVL